MLRSLLTVAIALTFLASIHAWGENKVKYQSPDLFPESLDWDAKAERFLVGSAKQGRIVAVSPDGTVNDFVEDPEYARNATLGVKVDPVLNRVVVAIASANPDVDYSAVAAYDLETGERKWLTELHTLLEEGGTSRANDVAVDAKGNVYVTDTTGNCIWKVDTHGSATVLTKEMPFTEDELTEIPGWGMLGPNGIVYHEQGGYLIVGHTSAQKLFKVTLPGLLFSSVTVTPVNTTEPLGKVDGMAVRPDGKVLVVSQEKVSLLDSSDNYASAQVVESKNMKANDGATAAVAKDGRNFVSYMFLPDFVAGSSRKKWEIVEVVFKADKPVKATTKRRKSSSRDAFQVLAIVVASVLCFTLLALALKKERQGALKTKAA